MAPARSMGYSGSAAGLLDAETNLTYAVKYLAGAYHAAGGNQSRAVALYASGYHGRGVRVARRARPEVVAQAANAGWGRERLGHAAVAGRDAGQIPRPTPRAASSALNAAFSSRHARPESVEDGRKRPDGRASRLGRHSASSVDGRDKPGHDKGNRHHFPYN